MAISVQNEQLANIYIKNTTESALPLDEQANWIETINSCKEATNGLSKDEKIQKLSENTLRMIGRMLHDRIESFKNTKSFMSQLTDVDKKHKESIERLEKELETRFRSLTEKVEKNNIDLAELKTETLTILNNFYSKIETVLTGKFDKLDERLNANDKLTEKLEGAILNEEQQVKKSPLKMILDFIKDVKWAIVTIVGFICTVLIFQPQLENLLLSIAHMIKH